MNESELLENIKTYMVEISQRSWRARRRLTNLPETGETFPRISYPLITTNDIDALRVEAWAAVQAVNFLYDTVAWMAAIKKEGREIEEAEE